MNHMFAGPIVAEASSSRCPQYSTARLYTREARRTRVRRQCPIRQLSQEVTKPTEREVSRTANPLARLIHDSIKVGPFPPTELKPDHRPYPRLSVYATLPLPSSARLLRETRRLRQGGRLHHLPRDQPDLRRGTLSLRSGEAEQLSSSRYG